MKSSRLWLLFILIVSSGCSGGGGGSFIPVVSQGTATLASILVTPVNFSVSAGTSQQFTATGVYTDNSKHTLTTPVTWLSSNSSVASIDPSTGEVLSLATGTTLITAETPSFSGTAVLKVTSGGAIAAANNVLPVTVNGALCSPGTSSQYPNKPCVRVTICTAGTNTCQIIDDILLDTGSYGLRLFQQVVSVPLTTVVVNSRSLAECIQFGDGSTDWGPVQLADVILGGEHAQTVPIQIINQKFAKPPSACAGPYADTSPSQTPGAGFNGILGVGLFGHDCGSVCADTANNGMYYSCSGSSCSGVAAPLPDQVQNPVSLLPGDNNGVILSLPSVSSTGSASATGSLILGIGTQSNNTPWAVTTYGADGNGEFTTVFNGHTYSAAVIDSGSNALFFPSGIAQCSGTNTGWYCPQSILSLLATNKGASGAPSAKLSFFVANADVLMPNITLVPNAVFNDLAAPVPGIFDWGLPFFFGRDVYVGIDGTVSPIGTGPYWAY